MDVSILFGMNYLLNIDLSYFALDPFILAQDRIDRGAIRAVLSGANVMCPGLTCSTARLANVPKNTIVVSLSSLLEQFL